VIAFAQTRVEEAAALLQNARVLWLPNLNVGADYYRHDGTDQSTDGSIIVDDKTAVAAGGGATLSFAVTDAIFRPLAARQELAASESDLQTARNDALLDVALAYFDVQQTRGILAGTLDAVAKAETLVRRVTGLARGWAPANEIDRAKALLFDLQQQAAVARGNWRVASARLTRVLRLNPMAVVVPIEPPHLQVALFSPGVRVADLVPIGLTNRPELASQRALVQAGVERVRQERFRPFIPNVLVEGAGPGGALNGTVFGGGPDGTRQVYGSRFDMDLGVVWTLNNLGAGNRSLVHERVAQQQRASIEFANLQDQVAQEVAQARAELEATTIQVENAMTAVKEAAITYRGNLIGISEPRTVGDVYQLVNRPQEAVAALQELNRLYGIYYAAINGYNRAQFRLYRAVGFPARGVVCDHPVGEVQNVDTSRPAGMAPDCPHVLSCPCP
jgi:outer membrane protein TolC